MRPTGSAPGRHSLSKAFPKPDWYCRPSLKGSLLLVVAPALVVPEGVDEAVAGLLWLDSDMMWVVDSVVPVATVNQSINLSKQIEY